MLRNIRADAFRFAGRSSLATVAALALTNRPFRPVLTLRLCKARAGGPFELLARILHRLAQGAAGVDLPWTLQAGPGLLVAHGWGLVVNPGARIGSNVTLLSGVVLGYKDVRDRSDTCPIIADDVWIGPHAIVIGGIVIGEGAIIGAGSVVVKDVHCIAAGNPARILREHVSPSVRNRAALPGMQA